MRDWGYREEDDQKERWLVTYADLITLLLVFFIVMYALSSRISSQNFDDLKSSLSHTLKKTVPKPGERIAVSPEDTHETRKFKANAAAVVKAIVATDPKSKVKIDIDERGLVVSLIDTSFFDAGSATLKHSAYPVLFHMAKTFKGLNNEVRIEGHTDAFPIRTARFPSNWELSSARATAVVRFLIDRVHLQAHRLSAVGLADTHPVASNGTADGRQRNRRVDLILVRSEDVAGGTGPGLISLTPAPKAKLPSTPRPDNGFNNPFSNSIGNPFKH